MTNSFTKYTFVIPARMESSRFPGKPLKKLSDRPIIDWVYENCSKSKFCEEVFIATDSEEISKYCFDTKKKYLMTGENNCASNRVAEASKKIDKEWIVEVQGDEPLLWASIMDDWLYKCSEKNDNNPDLFLSIAKLNDNEADDPSYVKIIKDSSNKLQWVSRSRIPCNLKKPFSEDYFRHTGFHLWKKESLLNFALISPSPIENAEDTHATRLVENNFFAKTIELPVTQSIDNPDDLLKAEMILKRK